MKEEWRTVEPIDWRYSAAIVGLVQYLQWLEADYVLTEEKLEYHPQDVNESDYLRFVEEKYANEMHHRKIEELLKIPEPTDDQVKLVNEKMNGNSALKKVFKKIKYDKTNAGEIQTLIDENREELIRETFRNKNNLYKNYCNTNQLFVDSNDCCRLVGYYIDMPKKGKSISYNFNMSNLVREDEQIFDFIPFAFHGERDFFFINDNLNLKCLVGTNQSFKNALKEEREKAENELKSIDARQVFFRLLIQSNNFIKNDIEVIVKNITQKYFETLYLRKDSLNILNSLKEDAAHPNRYQCFCIKIKVTDDYWLDVHKKVTDAIVNLVLLDDLIDYLLKNDEKDCNGYLISQLIRLNIEIKGDSAMNKSMNIAYACAKQVVNKKEGTNYKVADNKLNSYRNKLITALTFEDYDRFCQVLLNLANYADENFDFAYNLFEDFEKNKEVAYTFVNALRRKKD